METPGEDEEYNRFLDALMKGGILEDDDDDIDFLVDGEKDPEQEKEKEEEFKNNEVPTEEVSALIQEANELLNSQKKSGSTESPSPRKSRVSTENLQSNPENSQPPLLNQQQITQFYQQIQSHLQLLLQILFLAKGEQRSTEIAQEHWKKLIYWKQKITWNITTPPITEILNALLDIHTILDADIQPLVFGKQKHLESYHHLFSKELIFNRGARVSYTSGKTNGRLQFTSGEDQLLIIGLKTFGMDWEKIQKRYLPSKSVKQLLNRFKNTTSKRAPDNPIKALVAILPPKITSKTKPPSSAASSVVATKVVTPPPLPPLLAPLNNTASISHHQEKKSKNDVVVEPSWTFSQDSAILNSADLNPSEQTFAELKQQQSHLFTNNTPLQMLERHSQLITYMKLVQQQSSKEINNNK